MVSSSEVDDRAACPQVDQARDHGPVTTTSVGLEAQQRRSLLGDYFACGSKFHLSFRLVQVFGIDSPHLGDTAGSRGASAGFGCAQPAKVNVAYAGLVPARVL
jgi:hypothetical protein